MKKSRKSSGSIAISLILVFIVAICALTFIFILDNVFLELGFLLSLLIKIIIFIVAFSIQLTIHELGHLVAGLISGYKFGSFRIGSIVFVKDNGKLKIKYQSVVGTGGQCLMLPPAPLDGKIPVILYNLGGVLMNAISIPVCAVLAYICLGSSVFYAFLVFMILSSIIVILTNGVPLKMGMMNNDGSNACELRNNEEAMLSFYNQFMILDCARNGIRLKDMPNEYFKMPSKEGMQNSISASAAVFCENRLFDAHKFDEATAIINEFLYSNSALVGIYIKFFTADKIVIELLSGREEVAKKLYLEKAYQTFEKKMKTSINIIRTEYAFALLCEKNEIKANEVLERFNKCAQKHPYSVDVDSEREILSLIDDYYKKFG